jgi:hypothetical protein
MTVIQSNYLIFKIKGNFMKKYFYAIAVALALFAAFNLIQANDYNLIKKTDNLKNNTAPEKIEYKYPEFYKGIYLTVNSGNNFERLKQFVELAKKSGINTMVIDVQPLKNRKTAIPAEHVKYCIDNGIHPVARIVVFPEGLKDFPVSKEYIQEKLNIADDAAKNGFREIQFDYIRFNDSLRNRHVTINDRYKFIEGFLQKAKTNLAKYNVKTAADVFGRIPLNRSDLIGQRMEGLDNVVDYICPMAYPSHYTWSKKLQDDPYQTVFITSKSAKDRVKKAEIVTWIQAFRMKLGKNSYPSYIKDQIKAAHDADIRGYILWNANQDYAVPFEVVKNYYLRQKSEKNSITIR